MRYSYVTQVGRSHVGSEEQAEMTARIKNKTKASNGTNDKANEVPTSAATAPIQNANQDDNSSTDKGFEGYGFDEYREEYEAMVEAVTPTIELFKESFSLVDNPIDKMDIKSLFLGTLVPLYNEWEGFRNLDRDEIKEIGEQEVVEVRRNMISAERKLAALLPDIEEDWRDICEYCECNIYVREEIAKILKPAA